MQGSPDKFYSSPEWRALRRKVLARDGHCCTMCGVSVRGKGQSRVDHIQSVKARPDLALAAANCRTLCPACDNRRHSAKGRGGVERPAIGEDGLPDSWR